VLEEKIARLKGKEAALWFNSGYQANVGLFKALLKAGDAIFADKLSHASLIDGAQLSEAVLFRFHHNNLNHLEMLLKKYRAKYRQAIIVTESIFSMDGDRAPLKELTALKEKHHCLLMVDEAHATGIFGKNGAGVVEEENLSGEVDLIMGTFSKALGSFGAYVAADKTMIQYLVNTCRSFIYSTALPPAVAAANLAALKLLKTEPARRHILLKNAKFFRAQLIKAGFKTKGDSQIIPLIIGDNQKTMALSHKLKKAGYWVLPIRPPSVPPGEARLRFSLSYCHAQNSLEKLIKTLTT
jgi:8-amino-7-oxononanoate synthase